MIANSVFIPVTSKPLTDHLNWIICDRCVCSYRLYPEVLFPVPYLDCLAAAKHFLSREVLAKYAIDSERVAVSGDSAGGNLAAAVAQAVHKEDFSCVVV